MTEKIAVFGSAFNPPSLGHLSVLKRLSHFDQVLLVPSYSHAWGKQMLDFSLRCQMVELFIEEVDLANLKLCDVEQQLYQLGDSVTTHALLTALQALYPQAQLTFVIGPDNLLNFSKFAHADEILQCWSVLACPQTLDIRSTHIRDAITQQQDMSQLTCAKVAQFIEQNSLYQQSS